MTAPLNETRCPLCGGDNGCAPATSGTFETPCWCTSADFPPELLEHIAAADRGRSCLCARCASAAVQSGAQDDDLNLDSNSGSGPATASDGMTSHTASRSESGRRDAGSNNPRSSNPRSERSNDGRT